MELFLIISAICLVICTVCLIVFQQTNYVKIHYCIWETEDDYHYTCQCGMNYKGTVEIGSWHRCGNCGRRIEIERVEYLPEKIKGLNHP